MPTIYAGSSNVNNFNYQIYASYTNDGVKIRVKGTLTGGTNSSNANNNLYLHLRYNVSPPYSSTSSSVTSYGSALGVANTTSGATSFLVVNKPLNETSIPTTGITIDKTFTYTGTATSWSNVAVFLSSSATDPSASAGTSYMFVGKELDSSLSNKARYYTQTVTPSSLTTSITYHVNGGTITTDTSATTRYRVSSSKVQRSQDSGSTWSNLTTNGNNNAKYIGLYNVGTYKAKKTGYHVNSGVEYNLKADGSGNSFNQDSTADNYATDKNVTNAFRLNGNTVPTAATSVTLYVNWKPNSINPIWNASGGTVSSAYTLNDYGWIKNASTDTVVRSTVHYGGSITTPTAATFGLQKDGYTLTGWQNVTGADYGSVVGKTFGLGVTVQASEFFAYNGSTNTVANTHALDSYNKAVWEPIPYTITYNLDGGSVSGNPTSYNIETTTFTLKNPTKNGYTFTGWVGTDVPLSSTNVTIPKGSMGNRSYTATWVINKYSIAFNANGGSGTMTPQEKIHGTDFTLPANGFTAPANYTANGATVTRNTNGGNSLSSITVKDTYKYSFVQWRLGSASGTAYAVGSKYTTNAAATFYAQWSSAINSYGTTALDTPTRNNSTQTFTVTLNANGGSVSSTSLSSTKTTTYTFSKWNSNSSGTGTNYNATTAYSFSSNTTVYAIWSSSSSTTAVTLPTPTKFGYQFIGWGTSASATSGVTGSYTPSGNVTLYAIWKPIGCLTYNDNGTIKKVRLYVGNDSGVPKKLVLYVGDSSNKPKLLV